MKLILVFFTLSLVVIISGCQSDAQQDKTLYVETDSIDEEVKYECKQITRDTIVEKLELKIAENKPLFVHIFVPLCDDINQGIVPTNSSLGDGMNLKTNLYWGAGYGIKTHFKRLKPWQLIYDTIYPTENDVLERIIFKKTFTNGAIVFIIADAYRGDKMFTCLENYFYSLAGMKKDKFKIDSTNIGTYGNADLLIFNGHNGLMDAGHYILTTIDGIQRDAVSISCYSKMYFSGYYECANAYPLITSEDFLPPEAYVAEAIIDNWAMLKSEEEIRIATCDAMAKAHKKPLTSTRKMFATGW